MPDWRAVTRSVAQRVGIDPDIFERQIDQESGFNPNAKSGAGAQGIAQIVPSAHPSVDPFDPYAALTYAATWMKDLLHQYGGDYRKALAAYNAGPGAVDKYGGVPPFQETQDYVRIILGGLAPGKAEAAELDQPAPGGATVASNLPPAPAELVQAERTKGPPTNIRIIDPDITDPGDTTGPKIVNQNPTRRYFWASDNTYLDIKSVKAPGAPAGSDAVDHYEVVGGNALSKTPARSTAAPARETKIVTLPNGQRIKRTFERDPQTGQWNAVAALDESVPDAKEPAKPNNKQVVTRNGKSYIYDPDTNTFSPATGLPDEEKPAAKPTVHTIGGRIYTVDADGNVIKTADVRTPQEITAADQGVRKGALDIQKTERDLLPAQQQAIQGHYDTIKYVQGMLERGEIDPSQANAYIATSKAAAEAAIQGTTPFAIEKQKQDTERERQKMGVDLLNQRLSTTGSIGSSLLSAASSLASHAMLRPGQTTLGADPLGGALNFVQQANQQGQSDPIVAALLAGAGPGGSPVPRGLPPGAPSGLVPVLPAGASMPGAR